MTGTEKLVEAVENSIDEGIDWWEIFDSKAEANRILRQAIKETPDEGQIISLLSALDIDMFGALQIEDIYLETLYKLLDELEEL